MLTLAADRVGLGSAPVVFVQAQKDRFHTRAGKAELLTQGCGDQISRIPRVKNGVDVMGTYIVPAVLDIGYHINPRRRGAGVERHERDIKHAGGNYSR